MSEAHAEGKGSVGPRDDDPMAALDGVPIPTDAWVRIHLAHPVHGGVHVDLMDELVDLAEAGHHEAGHGNRVALLAERIAHELDPALAAAAFRAGLLHDIGKALLPFHPATLARRLSRPERATVDRHPELGAEFASWAGETGDVVAAVRAHHERLDGTGYPHGLRDGSVPYVAQIVAAADVMEALRSRRSYKPAWSVTAIGAYFRAHRRGWLSPEVWTAAMNQIRDTRRSATDLEPGLLEQP